MYDKHPNPQALKRLLTIAAAVIATDTAFYAVITPLLPHYADELDLSKQALGLLTAAYPAGVFLTAIPAGLLVTRIGPRTTMVAAMAVLAFACVVFGFSTSAPVLEAARFMQGAVGSLAWAGAFGWVVDAAPTERRGEMIGKMLAAGVAGSLLGPPVGALAEAIGTRALFSSVVVLCAGMACAALTLPVTPKTVRQQSTNPLRPLGRALRRPDVLLASWLVSLAGIVFGLIAVLGTLRLDAAGAGPVAIAAVFLTSAAVEMFLNHLLGPFVDRRGPLLPIRLGLAIAAAGLCLFAVPHTIVPQAAVVFVMCATASMWGPAMIFLSETAARTGLQQGIVFGLTNLAWAMGSVSGSLGGAALAGALGDGGTTAIAAALAAGSLALVLAIRLGDRAPSRPVAETV